MDNLKWIISNFDNLYDSDKMGRFVDVNYSVITDKQVIKNMLLKFQKKKKLSNAVDYEWIDGKEGRLFSKVLSLQGISRVIRHTLAKGLLTDIDIDNCHPMILYTECQRRNIPCPRLTEYIFNRNFILQETMLAFNITREEAKLIPLTLMNGGLCKYIQAPFTPFLEGFQIEMNYVRDRVCAFYPELVSRARSKRARGLNWNELGSACNYFLCMQENKILKVMVDSLTNQGFIISALVFDGCMVQTNETPIDLHAIELEIKTVLGYELTLSIKEMNEGIEVPITSTSIEAIEAIDRGIDFYWNDLLKSIRPIFDSKEELDVALGDLNGLVAHINIGGGHFIKKNDANNYDSVKDFGKLNIVRYYEEDKKKRLITTRLDTYLLNNSLVREYRKEVFKPALNHREDEFNLFDRIKAHVEYTFEDGDDIILAGILDFILAGISNKNEEVYIYVLSWLRCSLVTPWLRTKTFLILYSKNQQRSGKGSLINWIVKDLFGAGYCIVTSGLGAVTQKHNAVLKNKLFGYFDELPTFKGEYHQTFDTLKHLITDEMLMIEPKGVDPYMIENMCEYMGSTNNLHSVKIENGDARMVVLHVNEEREIDDPFWSQLNNDFLTSRGAVVFYNFLKTFEGISLKNIPNTTIRQEIIELNLSPIQCYINDIKNRSRNNRAFEIITNTSKGIVETVDLMDLPMGCIRISKSFFMSDFLIYCRENNLKPCSSKEIKSILKEQTGPVRYIKVE